jgi:hypothetical protein
MKKAFVARLAVATLQQGTAVSLLMAALQQTPRE